ncbi:hypothetical protein [Streptomyces triticisoli]|jgi:hypothetical protein|uniref:hypothetical protein n=1 Tax=Streptomyces triticisoli TaxID=2182797 RepID=UPI000DD7B4C8|nr:hypothetical protein [Streptomyces triticisoli]
MSDAEQRAKDEGPAREVSAAVERHIQRDLLEELLQAKEAEIGPPSSEVREWAAEIFGDAETMAADEKSTATRSVP